VEESLPEHETESAAMKKVATKLGISPEAIRRWKRQSEVDSGLRPGLSSLEHDEVRRLRRENAELRKANEVLKSASAFLQPNSIAPVMKMISFIDVFRDRFGVERICVTLGATEGGFDTSRGYRAAKRRPTSARSVQDELLIGEVTRLHE